MPKIKGSVSQRRPIAEQQSGPVKKGKSVRGAGVAKQVHAADEVDRIDAGDTAQRPAPTSPLSGQVSTGLAALASKYYLEVGHTQGNQWLNLKVRSDGNAQVDQSISPDLRNVLAGTIARDADLGISKDDANTLVDSLALLLSS